MGFSRNDLNHKQKEAFKQKNLEAGRKTSKLKHKKDLQPSPSEQWSFHMRKSDRQIGVLKRTLTLKWTSSTATSDKKDTPIGPTNLALTFVYLK